jgi:acetolactate synthase-1/2/3 large subunit
MSDDLAITSGGAIFRRLRQLGVDIVLVNSGTDFPPIIEGLAEAEAYGVDVPRAIVVPHEQVAMGIAHGYYFASGRAQAVILHTNVGLANGAIGAINAATDHVPVILMSGRTPTVERGRFGARTVPIGWGQEMRDQAALVREASKWEYEVRFPEQVPELLDRAYAIAMSTPKGPVYLSLPREVLCEPCPTEALDAPITMRAASVVASPDQVAAAAELLASAERPLIVAQRGAGSLAGFEAVARIAEQWSIPVCQYWAVATAISAEHPMYVGQDPASWVADADVILVIDSLAPWMPDAHEPPAGCKVVHLGPDPLFSRVPVRNFRSDLSITSEVGDGLMALERAMRTVGLGTDSHHRTRRRALADDRNATRREQSRIAVEAGTGTPMTKAWVSYCVGEAIRGRVTTVISELGCAFEQLGLTDHGSWRQEPHSGGLGWGLPCAMGIKLAEPDRLVVATMGDGSYMFANPVACHHVAEAHDIPVLTVVLNNAGYGAVRDSTLDLYPTGYAAKTDEMPLTGLSPTPDFAQVARACRAHAETVTDGADLPAALARAIHVVTVEHRQALLDVHVADRNPQTIT